MAKLDNQYISKLVDDALNNDGNAYAELFAATYPLVYSFSCAFLNNEKLAKETLNKTYVQAFSSLYQLQGNELFVLWVLQLNCQICMEYKPVHSIQIDNHKYSINQVLKLPLIESLALIMKYHTQLNTFDISKITDMPWREVSHSIKTGKQRLQKIPGGLS